MNFSQGKDVRRRENLDASDFRQSFFLKIPKRQRFRNHSGKFLLFREALRDAESVYRHIGAYDMKHSELKEMCRRARSKKFNHLYIDMNRHKKESKSFFNESKNTYTECINESETVWFFICCFQLKLEMIWNKLEELISLKNQVENSRLQDKLGK